MARWIVSITLLLWLLLALLAFFVRTPDLTLMPLYGLYPGPPASGDPGYNPRMMHIWAVGAALVFATLAFLGLDRKNKLAAVILLALFIASIVVA